MTHRPVDARSARIPSLLARSSDVITSMATPARVRHGAEAALQVLLMRRHTSSSAAAMVVPAD